MLRWVERTPLGFQVDPDVYMMDASSSGITLKFLISASLRGTASFIKLKNSEDDASCLSGFISINDKPSFSIYGASCDRLGGSINIVLHPLSTTPNSSSRPCHQEFIGTTMAPTIVAAI